MINSIVHPTDLSPESIPAFEHALRLALESRSAFTLAHVTGPGDKTRDSFPRVRETLARWGFIDPEAQQKDVLPRTGVAVRKVVIDANNVVEGLVHFLQSDAPDLLVMASHGRAGIDALLNASVTTKIANLTMTTTLIFGPAARPFVDSRTGKLSNVRTALMAIDHEPPAQWAVRRAEAESPDLQFDYVHVGSKAPIIIGQDGSARHVRTVQGPVVETLLAEAEHVDLIAMPMAGRKGLLDALRGSTTERIVRNATRPVMAFPV